jgi:hypothetical protein
MVHGALDVSIVTNFVFIPVVRGVKSEEVKGKDKVIPPCCKGV